MKCELNKIRNFILDLLFPIYCINCGIEGKKFICDGCFKKIKTAQCFICPICRKASSSGAVCEECAKSHFLNGLYAGAEYGDALTQKIIKTFKFKFIPDLCNPLADILIKRLEETNFQTQKFNLIIPVPLHKRRLNWRGFNQSELIASKLSERFNIPMNQNILARVRNTKAQSEIKSEEERKCNIQGAFAICPLPKRKEVLREKNLLLIKRKNILLVDDVCTTGSTLDECAKVLKQAGAEKIWGCTTAA